MMKDRPIAYHLIEDYDQLGWVGDFGSGSEINDRQLPLHRPSVAMSEEQIRALPQVYFVERLGGPPVPPDIVGRTIGPLIVSEKVKRIIETFEPLIHGFYGVGVEDRTTGQAYDPKYILHVRAQVDCVDYGRSVFRAGSGPEAAARCAFAPAPNVAAYFLDKNAISGKHIWMGARPAHRLLFLSDQLIGTLGGAGVALPPMTPWFA
jgi:hypothetical protein